MIKTPEAPWHGTDYGYKKGCRCQDCAVAAAEERRHPREHRYRSFTDTSDIIDELARILHGT